MPPAAGSKPRGASACGARRLVDRDVLDPRLPPRLVEALQIPVDQRPQCEQELADEGRDAGLELARHAAADWVEEDEQRGRVEAATAARGRGAGVGIPGRPLLVEERVELRWWGWCLGPLV